MPDTRATFDHLPILRELGDNLSAAFERNDYPGRADTMTGRKPRRWLLPVGLATAAVAAALALVSGIDNRRVGPEPATAAQVLRKAATAAEDQPAPLPRDDQFFYVRSRTTNLVAPASIDQADNLPTALVTKERRIWTSIDRSGRLEERIIATKFATGADRQKWERAGRPTLGATPATGHPISISPSRTYRLGTIELTRQQMLDFPTDPRAIYDRLRDQVARRGHSPESEVFTELGDALRESPAPAQLRAALYRTLALVPGVQLVGQVTDGAGRSGTAVALTETGVRHELIFDPNTSETLAERDVLIDPKAAELNLPAGTVIGDSLYLQRAVTDQPTTP
jgi:hypothetical protein